MFSLFKFNNPGVVVFYLVYLILFRLCFLFDSSNISFDVPHREPLTYWTFSFLKSIPVSAVWLSLCLSTLLCFLQAVMVNRLVNNNKILPRKSYVTGLVYIILFSLLKENLSLQPSALALTFVILATGSLFSLARKEKSNGDIFDSGFLIAIATLFYFPAIVFLLFIFIGLALVRPFAYREWLIVLLGFCSPFFLVFTYYYWNDQAALLPGHLAHASAFFGFHGLAFSFSEWFALISISILAVLSVLLLPSALYSSLIQVRKFATVLALFVFLVPLGFLLQHTISLSHFVLLSFPLAILLSMVLIQIKRTLVSEVIHLILILLILAEQYLPLFISI